MITHYHTQLQWLLQPELPAICAPRPGRRLYLPPQPEALCPHQVVTREASARVNTGPWREGDVCTGRGKVRVLCHGDLPRKRQRQVFLEQKDLIHKDTDLQPQLQAGQALHVFRPTHMATKTSTRLKTPLKGSFPDRRSLSPKHKVRLTVNRWHWNRTGRQKAVST